MRRPDSMRAKDSDMGALAADRMVSPIGAFSMLPSNKMMPLNTNRKGNKNECRWQEAVYG